jgi:hypothetical protein
MPSGLFGLLGMIGAAGVAAASTSEKIAEKAPLSEAIRAAAVYFVDSSQGFDGAEGTAPARAWRSTTRVAAASLRPGDHVLFRRGGVWRDPLVLPQSGVFVGAFGSSTAPLPLFTAASDSCVDVRGHGNQLQNFRARGCGWAGVRFAGSGNTLQHAVVQDNVTGVHVAAGARGNRVLHNQIVNNRRMHIVPGPNNDSGAFGVLLNGDHTVVAYNTIAGHHAKSPDYGADGSAVEVSNGRFNSIHHNVAVQNQTFTELGGSRSTGNVYHHNVVRATPSGPWHTPHCTTTRLCSRVPGHRV